MVNVINQILVEKCLKSNRSLHCVLQAKNWLQNRGNKGCISMPTIEKGWVIHVSYFMDRVRNIGCVIFNYRGPPTRL